MKLRAQGIIEYLVMLTLIVGAIILAARPLMRNSVDAAIRDTEHVSTKVIDGFLAEDGYGTGLPDVTIIYNHSGPEPSDDWGGGG